MKKIFTFLSLFLCAFLLQAQTRNAGQNDPNAKKILDAVSAKFRTLKSPQVNFTFQTERADGKVVNSETGTLYLRGNRYYMKMDPWEFFSDGKNTWTYNKTTNDVTISNVKTSAGAITPQNLFTNFYDNDFLYKLNGEKKVSGKTIQEIELTPTDKKRPYHKVYVWVDKATKLISSAKILQSDRSSHTIAVQGVKPNPAVPDSRFVFDKKKYPGIEVIDNTDL